MNIFTTVVTVATCGELKDYYREHGVTDLEHEEHPGDWGRTFYQIVVNGLSPADVTLDSTSPTLAAIGTDPAIKCFRMTQYTLDFAAETQVVVIDWQPANLKLWSTSCHKEWLRLANQVIAHEQKHVNHIERAVTEANKRMRTAKALTGCGATEALARKDLLRQVQAIIVAEVNRIETRITDLGVPLDRESFVMECRQCPTALIKSLTISPKAVVGGAAAEATVTLSAAAPAGGVTVNLESDRPAANVPNTIRIPAGKVSGTAKISTEPVQTDSYPFITATVKGDSLDRREQIAVRHPQLKSIVIPGILKSQQKFTGTVTITGKAPSSGVVVVLRDQAPTSPLSHPGVVVVKAGKTSQTFEGSVGDVPSQRTGQIVADAGGSVKPANTTLKP